MLGYPGAGKTHTAKLIEQITEATRLSSDEQRTEMFDKPDFSQEEHDKLYNYLDKKTEELLEAGKSVIYDANLNRKMHRQDKYKICEKTGAKPILVWVRTPKELAKERATHVERAHLWPKDETPHDMFDRIAGVIEKPTSEENPLEIIGQGLDAKKVEEFLKQHGII